MTKISFVNPNETYAATGYSHIVSVENPSKTIYLSGQVARDKKGELVGKDDLEAQTRQVYRNLETLLKNQGASFKGVVKQNIYTTRADEIQTIRNVRDEFLGASRLPASTLVVVPALALPEFLVEIEMTAVL